MLIISLLLSFKSSLGITKSDLTISFAVIKNLVANTIVFLPQSGLIASECSSVKIAPQMLNGKVAFFPCSLLMLWHCSCCSLWLVLDVLLDSSAMGELNVVQVCPPWYCRRFICDIFACGVSVKLIPIHPFSVGKVRVVPTHLFPSTVQS